MNQPDSGICGKGKQWQPLLLILLPRELLLRQPTPTEQLEKKALGKEGEVMGSSPGSAPESFRDLEQSPDFLLASVFLLLGGRGARACGIR